jgi:hypothetical protein
MKWTNLIFGLVLIVISITPFLAYPWDYVCVDPGHGGNDPGTHGHV